MPSLANLSVIVTCYNKVDYLGRFKLQVKELAKLSPEIIIVDDCSNDGSRECLSGFVHSVPNIVYIENSINKGSAQSRNTAIQFATRRFVFFWDIDDQINIAMLETMTNIAELESVDICRGDFIDQALFGGYHPEHRNKSMTKHEISTISHQLVSEMGYWRYLYSRSFIIENKILFMPTLEQLAKEKFILDDVFFMILVSATRGKAIFLQNYPPVYIYSKPFHNRVSWLNFLDQAQWFARASNICIDYLKNYSTFSLKDTPQLIFKKAMTHARYLRLKHWRNSLFDVIRLIYRLKKLGIPASYYKTISLTFSYALRNSLFYIRMHD